MKAPPSIRAAHSESKALPEVESGFNTGFTSEAGLGVGGGAKDVITGFVGARRAGSFGEDGGGERRRGGGEAEEPDGLEERGPDEAEATADARKNGSSVCDSLGVGDDAVDV